MCDITTNASASFFSVSVSPQSAPQGAKFHIETGFKVTNGTIGTGQLALVVLPPGGGLAIEDRVLLVDVGQGSYSGNKFVVDTKPSDNYPFLDGVYLVQLSVCAGTCGSTWPYSTTLAKTITSFNISTPAF